MKKVLLIGDSIRLSYRDAVSKLLAGRAEVLGPDDNCRFSAYTLFNLSNWVCDDDYDVIQWNNGQWDTCHMLDGKIHTPLSIYLELQARIASILLKKTKRLIFATTTPVWPEHFTTVSVRARRNEDIVAYNMAVTEMLSTLGVEINDLHSLIVGDIKQFICDDMVHLTDQGVEICAKAVAKVVAGEERVDE